MSDTYYVKTLGGLEITNDNVTVNIVELFGKQLVNLLQVLLFHSEKPVQKDELIDILWPESKNPSSALKFSIFRLRAELNEIEFFKDKEVIVNGKAFVSVESIDVLKHYAKDAGKSQAAIDSITEPKVTYSFMANGVLIAK